MEEPKIFPIEHNPKVGLRQPGWQLLRDLFGEPYLNPFAEDAVLSPAFLEFALILRVILHPIEACCKKNRFSVYYGAIKSPDQPPQRVGTRPSALIGAHLDPHSLPHFLPPTPKFRGFRPDHPGRRT